MVEVKGHQWDRLYWLYRRGIVTVSREATPAAIKVPVLLHSSISLLHPFLLISGQTVNFFFFFFPPPRQYGWESAALQPISSSAIKWYLYYVIHRFIKL